jgi:Na+/glutamate symporter
MSDKQADSALDKISLVGGHYSAKSVRETINKFQFEDTKGIVTVHPLPESPNTVDS